MSYTSRKLRRGRYGICINSKIIAYINCPDLCNKLVESLKDQLAKTDRVNVIEEVNAIMPFLTIK